MAQSPVFAMLTRTPAALRELADALLAALVEAGVPGRIGESVGQPGGGSAPEGGIPSVAVELLPQPGIGSRRATFAELLHGRLLNAEPPVLGVLREGRLWLDVLTIFEEDIPRIAAAAAAAVARLGEAERA